MTAHTRDTCPTGLVGSIETSRTTSRRRYAASRSLARPVAFWLVAAAIATVTGASSAPSPLYPVYQAQYRFSEITLTAIFALYVFALIVSLLTVGRLSDYVGRRLVLAGAVALETGARGAWRRRHEPSRTGAMTPGSAADHVSET
jgi:MFS family permease